VLCEKPLARRPPDVERAFDAADRAGRLPSFSVPIDGSDEARYCSSKRS